MVLPRKHRLAGRKPLAFADALDEDWISLNTGAAMLQQLQQAALGANRPLRLRMQVRSFDAVCHLVASGLGVAVLPKAAALPIVKAMALDWRPLADAWAQRQLLVAAAAGSQGDAAVEALVSYLAEPSRPAKARKPKQQ
jgi:DNA-binding transcriptional LysR family regulator